MEVVNTGSWCVLLARYDAATDRWLPTAPMMTRRFALGAATLENCVYAVRARLLSRSSALGSACIAKLFFAELYNTNQLAWLGANDDAAICSGCSNARPPRLRGALCVMSHSFKLLRA